MRKREIQAAIKAFGKAIDKLQHMNEKYQKKFQKDMSDIGRSVIDEWYDDYDRWLYDPYGSLYYAYKVDVKKNGLASVKFSPKFIQHIPHNQKSTIIYNNAFLEGYHGGSTSKKYGITEPTWRTPVPFFNEWYPTPAERSFSPYEKMHELMSEKAREIEDEHEAEIKHISDKLAPHIKRMKGE